MDAYFLKDLLLSLVIVPFAFTSFLGLCLLFNLKWKEKTVTMYAEILGLGHILLIGSLIFLMIYFQVNQVELTLKPWFDIGTYNFELSFKLDKISLPFILLSSILTSIIAKYSATYLHRDRGFHRFYFLLMIFMSGCSILTLAGTIDLIFVGWELVGLSSVFLIAFFYHRSNPINNSYKALITYRISDIGLLAASAWMHFALHSSNFGSISQFVHDGVLDPELNFKVNVLAGFILFAALGKSAQLPFTSWLPGSMEGPTPSSAIFYGAISIHLGPYLLLRAYPILEHAECVRVAIVIIGFLTALYASGIGRTRTDAKTILAYATMAQVGVIFMEIGAGFTRLALFHVCAHAILRTLQFLRASSVIQDFLENPLVYENTTVKTGYYFEKMIPLKLQKKLYIGALNHFYVDYFLTRFILRPFLSFFELMKQLEDKWIKWL